MADPIIPPFVPSVVISENDLIADTDDKIITIMGEAGTYLQAQTQNASDTINSNVNKIFTATFQGTVGQTTTNLISGLITSGQTISVNCLVISANGILGRIAEINNPNVIILWLQEITTTSIYKLVIEGTVNTVGDLPIAPIDGTTYAVGLTEPRDIYIYDTTNGWVNQGTLKGLDGTNITSVTSSKVGLTTTVTINGTFDNAPYSFNIEDGSIDAYTKTEVQTILPVIGFNTATPTTPTVLGQIAWNAADGTHESYLGNGVMLQFGLESLIPVKNNTASIITNGTICMSTGSVGASGKITVAPMDGTVQSNANKIIGMATQDIAIGGFGFVTTQGTVRGINTSTLTEQQPIYVSTTVIGGITTTPPTTGMKLKVGQVIYSHATVGSILFRTTILDENLYVKKTGDETIAGIKTFSSSPIVPVPTLVNQVISMGNIIEKTGAGIGYANGSGGVVTQLTSKAQSVTIDKISGQITTHNASLASLASINFLVVNNKCTANDVCIITVKGGIADYNSYDISCVAIGDGGFRIRIKNVSGGALSEAIIMQYDILKGAIA